MKCCVDKSEGCCCVPISNLVCAFLFHSTVHGAVAAMMGLTTELAIDLETVDYYLGYNGIALSVTSGVTIFFIRIKKLTFLRSFLGFCVCMAIVSHDIATMWYTIQRWHTEKATVLFKSLAFFWWRGDLVWYIWAVLSWVVIFLSPYYMICILSCMCNPYKRHLFTQSYQHAFDETRPNTSIPLGRYQGMSYKPYPTQDLQRL